MTRRERNPMLALVGVLGLGLLAAAYAIWTLESQVRGNQSLIRQQQQAVSELLARDAANTQALSDQQRLTRALQAQVLKLGGKPLLTAPAAPPQRPSPTSTGAVPATTPTPSAPRPSATPRPTPRPTPSQSPTPKPSPTPSPTPCAVKVGPICL